MRSIRPDPKAENPFISNVIIHAEIIPFTRPVGGNCGPLLEGIA
ncbi:unnamed protein product, partial [marine sediment metagenome]